jgi:hypothetical protein
LQNDTDSNLTKRLLLYANENQCSEETKNFAKAAIDAWMEDGEVDFQNEIIKDPSFIGTKADCVLNTLISTNNNLFKKTSQAFTGNRSKFKIKFITYMETTDVADARTPLPDENGIIEIRFNMAQVSNSNAIDLARIIFHETIHAELHRIKLTNNAGPNPLPQAQYNWYIEMWKYYENIFEGNQNSTATASEHNYMALHQINNIAQGLRQFDQNTHPLENYKYFAWTGLEYYGEQNKYITEAELSALAHLTTIVNTDNHINPCD